MLDLVLLLQVLRYLRKKLLFRVRLEVATTGSSGIHSPELDGHPFLLSGA